MAVFFLAFTAYDLLSPEACAEELLGLPLAAIAAAAETRRDSSPAVEAEHGEGERHGPAEPFHAEEDCFCCCSHLLVRPVFVFGEYDPAAFTRAEPRLRFPSSPPHCLYRPPRV